MGVLAENRRSREGCYPGDLIPNSKVFGTESAIIHSREQMASGTEVRGDDPVHLDKALDMPSRLKPSHASLPFTRRLMGVLGSVI